MTTWTNTAEGGTEGVAATVANSGGASGDAFSLFPSAGALEYRAAEAVHGSMGYLIIPQSGVIREARINIDSVGSLHWIYYWTRYADATAPHTLLQLRHGSGNMATLVVSASNPGRINVANALGTTVHGVAAATSVIGTPYRLELRVDKASNPGDPNTGRIRFTMYELDETSAMDDWDSDTVGGANVGTANPTNIRVGRPSGTTTDETSEGIDTLQAYTDADLPATMNNPYVPPPTVTEWYVAQGGLLVPATTYAP